MVLRFIQAESGYGFIGISLRIRKAKSVEPLAGPNGVRVQSQDQKFPKALVGENDDVGLQTTPVSEDDDAVHASTCCGVVAVGDTRQ